MAKTITRKIFQNGGSKAIRLPKGFPAGINEEVIMIYDGTRVMIKPEKSLDNIESEAEFGTFIKALVEHSLKNPEELDDLSKIWDKEWDGLLENVDEENDE